MKTKQTSTISAQLLATAVWACTKGLKRKAICIFFFIISYGVHAAPAGYPLSYSPKDMLIDLLAGQWDAQYNTVKWKATPGDVHEFNGVLSTQPFLYSVVDTTFVMGRGDEQRYYVVFSTAPMMADETGELVNANSCHVCGVNLGFFSYTKDNDSIYLDKFKRNIATHGSFGSRPYALSLINLGDGYELLQVDDPYEGMGTTSIATRFYSDGELVLSMISAENNQGNRERNEKGYYEFTTAFTYDPKMHSITIRQTGYRIGEQSGKKIVTNKTKKLVLDNNTLQF